MIYIQTSKADCKRFNTLVQIQTVCINVTGIKSPLLVYYWYFFFINRTEEWGQKIIGNQREDFPHEHHSSMCPQLLGHSSNTLLALVVWRICSVWTKKTDKNNRQMQILHPIWLKWWIIICSTAFGWNVFMFIKIVCHLEVNWVQFSSWIFI